MESLREIKRVCVPELLNWEVDFENIKFAFQRKINGEHYFTCTSSRPSKNRPIYITVSQLRDIFDTVYFWTYEQYSQLFEAKIPGDEICEILRPILNEKRIVLSYTSNSEGQILDVRVRMYCKETEEFVFTNFGFTIRGGAQIDDFLKLREEFDSKIEKVVKFEEYLEKAYAILYAMYKDMKKEDLNLTSHEIMEKADRVDFGKRWSNEVLIPQIKDNDSIHISGNSIFYYIKSRCRSDLKESINLWDLLDSDL